MIWICNNNKCTKCLTRYLTKSRNQCVDGNTFIKRASDSKVMCHFCLHHYIILSLCLQNNRNIPTIAPLWDLASLLVNVNKNRLLLFLCVVHWMFALHCGNMKIFLDAPVLATCSLLKSPWARILETFIPRAVTVKQKDQLASAKSVKEWFNNTKFFNSGFLW